MRRIIEIILLASILSMIVGCEKPKPCVSCDGGSFTENYIKNIQKDEIFFIKGEALSIYKYGRNIKIIEDLKGNFADKPSVFVWGIELGTGRLCSTEPHKVDYITQYNTNDTLIMILGKAHKRFDDDIEKRGDYTTIACAYSVLKLSNDTVVGVIYPGVYGQASWIELQEELLNTTK